MSHFLTCDNFPLNCKLRRVYLDLFPLYNQIPQSIKKIIYYKLSLFEFSFRSFKENTNYYASRLNLFDAF